MSAGVDLRCACGPRCALRRPVYADDTTVRTGWEAAPVEPGDGLCVADTHRLLHTLGDLPRLVARLHVAHLPAMAVRYRSLDFTDGAERIPIPLNEHADALARLLDHELQTWADAVADAAGMVEAGEWRPELWDRMRVGVRITQACELLHYRHAQWLAHGPLEHRGRSLADLPSHGLDDLPGVVDRYDVWITRTGGQAAAVVLDLAERARRFTVPDGTDWIPVPCGGCGARKLHRHHTDRVVRCHRCGRESTDDQHDAFLAAALGETPDVTPGRPEGPVWLPESCPACGHRSMWLDGLAGARCRCTGRTGRAGGCCWHPPLRRADQPDELGGGGGDAEC